MILQNATTLVTGGASGLGEAVVKRFLKQGSQVAVLDLPTPANEAKVSSLGNQAIFCGADITDSAQIKACLEKVKEKFNKLNVLVNCAGIASAVKTITKGEASPLEIFSKTIQVNLIGTFDVCRQAAVLMTKSEPNKDGERGVIINTASVAALEGQMGQTAYAASKGGVASLTLPLARDLASYGIRAMTIAPGLFDTPMLASLPEAARESLAQQIPFPSRFGDPDEYAALAQHIVENPMLNGELIRADGALRMGMK